MREGGGGRGGGGGGGVGYEREEGGKEGWRMEVQRKRGK